MNTEVNMNKMINLFDLKVYNEQYSSTPKNLARRSFENLVQTIYVRFIALLICIVTMLPEVTASPRKNGGVIELAPIKVTDPAKFSRVMATIQGLDLKEQEAAYNNEIKAYLKEKRSIFVIRQALGNGEYLVESRRRDKRIYHLTLLDDMQHEGGLARGEYVDPIVQERGVFHYENTQGAKISVRKIQEIKRVQKPVEPQKKPVKIIEQLMRNGKHYTMLKSKYETCYRCNGAKLVRGIKCSACHGSGKARVTRVYKIIWGKAAKPEQADVKAQVQASTHLTEDPPVRVFGLQDYDWTQNKPAIKMKPLNMGLGMLSSLGGRFLGGGEAVRVEVESDGFWYLNGKSMQPLRATAIFVQPKRAQLLGSVRAVSWGSGKPRIRLIESHKGFAYLSAVSGRFLSGETFVRVKLDPDGWWYLEGNGPKNVASMATIVEWGVGHASVDIETATHTWKKGNKPIKMIHQNEGFCFLSSIGGGFNGGGERIWIDIGSDGFWYLHGKTGRVLTRGEAISIRFKKK